MMMMKGLLSLSNRFTTLKAPIQAIKKLREQTSAPISQCKTALEQNNLDHTLALRWLKQKGLLQAQKRVNKQTREGVIGAMVTACRSKVALVQVNCQTDFVAKNDLFISFVNNVLAKAIQTEYTMEYQKQQDKQNIQYFLNNAPCSNLFPQDPSISTLNQQYKIMISRLQQNIRIRRIITLHSDNRRYGIYVHQGYDQYVGQQASVVQFSISPLISTQQQQEEQSIQQFGQFADNIATQILGTPPKYLRNDQIPQQQLQNAKDKVLKQMAQRLTKAPAHTHAKIVDGKLYSDFYQQCLLEDMPYVLSNQGVTVGDYWRQVEDGMGKRFRIERAFSWTCK